MSDPIRSFIGPMQALHEIEVPNPQAFLDRLTVELEKFEDIDLQEAVGWICRNRTRRTFPTIAECVAAVTAVREVRLPPAEPRRQGDAASEWLEGQKRAREVCRGPLVREAFDGGWFGGLWDFCAENHRMPNRSEIPRISRRSAETRMEMDRIIRDEPASPFASLARAMIERYTATAREIIGEAAE